MTIETHAAEAVDFDVTDANGTHRIEHGLAAVNAALTAGARYAVEVGIRTGVYQEERAWAEAIGQQHRADVLAGGAS